MASTPTTRNRLNKQAQGDSINAWGGVLNASVFDLVDEALDGLTTLAITGNVSLTSTNYASDQSRKRILRLTGAPGATYTITLPSVEKYYVVHNTTASAQQLKAGGLAATVPANTLSYVYCDGTDSYAPTAGVTAAIGAIMDFASSVAPSGWLLCYGQAISRTTYSSLFQVTGTAYGVGDGSTTFNVPDLRGRASFGKDDMGGSTAGRISGSNSFAGATTLGTAGGDDRAQSHTHTINIFESNHTHASNAITGGSVSAAFGGDFSAASFGGAATINGNVTGLSATSSAQVNAGNAGNMPPALILNKIIYSGV